MKKSKKKKENTKIYLSNYDFRNFESKQIDNKKELSCYLL